MMTMLRVHAVIAARHRAWQTPSNERTGLREDRQLRCHGVGAEVGDLWSSEGLQDDGRHPGVLPMCGMMVD